MSPWWKLLSLLSWCPTLKLDKTCIDLTNSQSFSVKVPARRQAFLKSQIIFFRSRIFRLWLMTVASLSFLSTKHHNPVRYLHIATDLDSQHFLMRLILIPYATDLNRLLILNTLRSRQSGHYSANIFCMCCMKVVFDSNWLKYIPVV